MEIYKKIGNGNKFVSEIMVAGGLDYIEYHRGYKSAKRSLEKGWDDYYLIYYNKLEYTVPIAFQDKITLINGFNNDIINDVYNYDPNYQTKDLHICVFPLESSTAIMMFVHKDDMSRYRKFYKEFKKKDETEKLEIINFLIFAYSENFFLSPYLADDLLRDIELKKIAKLASTAFIDTIDIVNVNPMQLLVNKYNFEKAKSIPNLLLLDINECK